MSDLKIRAYDVNPRTGDEELTSVVTIPLAIVNIVAKHIPDRLVRIITDRRDPGSGSVSFNPHTLMQMTSEILQDIETQRKRGAVKETIIEIKLTGRNLERLAVDAQNKSRQIRNEMLQRIETLEKRETVKETSLEMEDMGRNSEHWVADGPRKTKPSRIVFSVEPEAR